MNGTEIAAVGQIAQELAINILKLECEGLRSTNRNLNKIVRHLTHHNIDIENSNNNSNNNINTTESDTVH